jgi:hypothetical protein
MARGREERERKARSVAERKARLFGELLRYGAVCGLLLVFVRGIGAVVAFFWGIGLARRAWALVIEPALHERIAERELERALRREGRTRGEVEEEDEREGRPDPRRRRRLAELRVSRLLDDALAERAWRIERAGAEVRREADVEGATFGDPELLAHALGDLVDGALDAIEGGQGRARLELLVGENLAGSEVFARIRGRGGASGREPIRPERLGLAAPRRIAKAHGGALEASALPGGGLELLLTLPKREPPRAARHSGIRSAG